MSEPATRARRLVALYPRSWRARYGDEFTQLLIDDMAERPRSLTRAADVLGGAVLARLARAGLAGDTLDSAQRFRAALAATGIAAGAFLLAGIAIWSQLTIGWQWSRPWDPATRGGMLLMTFTLPVLAALAVFALLPPAVLAARELLAGRGHGLDGPLLVLAAGTLLLVVGSVHIGHGWPGTGGHPWSGRELVPVGLARFCWAATLWISAYWLHPHALATFPAVQIAWMVASPLAELAVLAGAGMVLRRLPLSPRLLRYECWLGLATAIAMSAFLAGAAGWVLSSAPAQRGLFRVGVIDAFAVATMAVAVIVASRATRRALAVR